MSVPSSWAGRYLPAYEDGTECSETSAYKIKTPESYPKESIQHSQNLFLQWAQKCLQAALPHGVKSIKMSTFTVSEANNSNLSRQYLKEQVFKHEQPLLINLTAE